MRTVCALLLAAVPLLAQQTPKEQALRSDLERGLAQKNGSRVLVALNNLESFYGGQHAWAQQAAILKTIVSYWTSKIGRDSIAIARYSADLAEAEEHAGDVNAALNHARFAVAMFERDKPKYEAATIRAQRILASVLRKNGNQDEADALSAQLPPQPPSKKPDQYPRLLSKREPDYTNAARDKWISGNVVLSLVIDGTGKPRDIRVISPLGFGLDENAVKALSKWKFAPAMMHGTPVAQQATVEVNFQLIRPG